MRYAVILCDGMADYPIAEIDNKTPMMAANKPVMNALAKNATQGLATTLYEDLPKGSDVANLSVLGFDSHAAYTGRSPIEALGLQIPLFDNDTIFRLNLVTLTHNNCDFSEQTILDHSGGKITSEEAFILLDAVRQEFSNDKISFYDGVTYRHIMTWKDINYDYTMTPPHDILGQKIGDYMPKGTYGAQVEAMMRRSYEVLMAHPLNISRMQHGLEPANCIWLWGEGTKPALSNFKEKYGVTGSVITAVPLIQGIARGIGLDVIEVEGATGDYWTNYRGKGQAAAQAITNGDEFLFVHIEAPDECGHDGDLDLKIKSIEHIDEEILTRVKRALEQTGEDYKILIMPDHATPIAVRTHTIDAIPFMIYDSTKTADNAELFDEESAKVSGIYYQDAFNIMGDFIK
ncbi:MAG: cofactor-independent phosphoglycerate mutase [Clostridia bacterium]